MVGNGDFQVICRICNKPLKLGIDTAADEDGKALHETCYVKQDHGRTTECSCRA